MRVSWWILIGLSAIPGFVSANPSSDQLLYEAASKLVAQKSKLKKPVMGMVAGQAFAPARELKDGDSLEVLASDLYFSAVASEGNEDFQDWQSPVSVTLQAATADLPNFEEAKIERAKQLPELPTPLRRHKELLGVIDGNVWRIVSEDFLGRETEFFWRQGELWPFYARTPSRIWIRKNQGGGQ